MRQPESHAEYSAFVQLQRETWGHDFSETIPVSMLQVTAKMGGVVLGAFAGDGELLGLVYGITGLNDGELAHWSHMLAVSPAARDRGIGQQLKERQRQLLLDQQVSTMYWTYDPLIARNAHLNLNRLGVQICDFIPDMYEASDSELHDLGTDRFVVKWDLEEKPARPDRLVEVESERLLVVGPPGENDDLPEEAKAFEMLIPSDLEATKARSVEEAWSWRLFTRKLLSEAIGNGFEVAGFIGGKRYGRYILRRTATDGPVGTE